MLREETDALHYRLNVTSIVNCKTTNRKVLDWYFGL